MNAPRHDDLRHALATAWSAQLADVEHYLPRAMAGTEPEDLHQFRVALRRTRALLTLFRRALPQAEPFRAEFKWLARATGAARDLDVQADHARSHGDAGQPAAAAPILAELAHRRGGAQRQLRAVLESPRTRALLAHWRQFVGGLPAQQELPPAAAVPAWTAIEVAILRNSRRLLRDGAAIDATTPADALHELRIRGKRLRYLLESLDLSAHEDRVGPLRRKLRKLQTLLGEHQDAIVAEQQWRQLAATLRRRQDTTAATLALLRGWADEARLRQIACRAALPRMLKKFAQACAAL